jgi:hypothetical protein
MSHTNYEIFQINAIPWDNQWEVNDQVYDLSDELFDDQSSFMYNGEEIQVLRWNSETNTISYELGEHYENGVTSLGEAVEEGVINPRTHPILSRVIHHFENAYLNFIYEQQSELIANVREASEDDVKNGFNFTTIKIDFLALSDWFFLPDSDMSEESKQEWMAWRQRIRDWQAPSDDSEESIRNLAIPVPPSTTNKFGKSLSDAFENFEYYKNSLRKLESARTLNFTKTDVTKEEYLENGPINNEIMGETILSEDEFLSKYSLQPD